MGSVTIDTSALADLQQDQPVVMLNLLRYNTQAVFAAGDAHGACSGVEAYGEYARAALPLVEAIAAKIIYAGHAAASLIAADEEPWDDVLIVEYPSVASVCALFNNPDYQKVLYLRTAALSDSRLIAMQQGLLATF